MTVATKRKTYPGADATSIDPRVRRAARPSEALGSSHHASRIDHGHLCAANVLSASRAEMIDRVIAQITVCFRALDGEFTQPSPTQSPRSSDDYAPRSGPVQHAECLCLHAQRQAIEALEAEVEARALRFAGFAGKLPHGL